MTKSRYASVSVFEKASGCCDRWQADLAAIRWLFRQRRSEAQRAAAPSRAPTSLPHPFPEKQTMSIAATSPETWLLRRLNWRAWRLRVWCLRRYLANNPNTPPSPFDRGKG
jgi:hypothetical protein